MLCASGQHPIRFTYALQDQIVDHHPDIALCPVEGEGSAVARERSSIGTRDKPLSGGFFISRRAIDLTSQEKSLAILMLERGTQAPWIAVTIFNRVTWLHHYDPLKTLDRTQELPLGFGRQGSRYPIGINHHILKPFRLKEYLMTVTVAEAIDLVFDRRTITWPTPFDRAAKERRFGQPGSDDIVSAFVGSSQRASELRKRLFERGEREAPLLRVAELRLRSCPVNRAAIDPRRGPGFEETLGQPEIGHLIAKVIRRRIADSSPAPDFTPAKESRAEERAGGQNRRSRVDSLPVTRQDADATTIAQRKALDGAFNQFNAWVGKFLLDGAFEPLPVCLHSGPAHCATLARIKHPPVDSRTICRAGHYPAERVNLADQMAFSDATDRRIARHSPHITSAERRKRHTRAASCSGRGRFHTSVTAANDEYIKHYLH